jgi:transposase
MRCLKVSLQAVLKGLPPERQAYVTTKIRDITVRSGHILTNGLLLLKLFLLRHGTGYGPVTEKMIRFMFQAVSSVKRRVSSQRRPPNELQSAIQQLYQEHFHDLQPDSEPSSQAELDTEASICPSRSGLGQVLNYASKQVLTNFENNIKTNFPSYVHTYVDAHFDKRGELEKLRSAPDKSPEKVKAFYTRLQRIKRDLLAGPAAELQSDPVDQDWVRQHQRLVLPIKAAFEKDSVHYDLQRCPQDYWPAMRFMTSFLESKGYKLPSLVPLRTSCIPPHVVIDTKVIIQNLLEPCHGFGTKTEAIKKLIPLKDDLWNFFFNLSTSSSRFRMSGHQFHHMIRTDGVSCCLVLSETALSGGSSRVDSGSERKSLSGDSPADSLALAPDSETTQPEARRRASKKRKSRKMPGGLGEESYVDELSEETREALQRRKVVGIDPNMGDLLYCVSVPVDSEDSEQGEPEGSEGRRREKLQVERFRYTANQRRKESKKKKFAKLIEALKSPVLNEDGVPVRKSNEVRIDIGARAPRQERPREDLTIYQLVEGKTIEKWESGLTAFNSRTVDVEGFKAYIREKLLVNSKVRQFYEARLFRKLRLNAYWNARASEQRAMTRFRRVFGGPEEVVVGIGDWEQKKHRTFMEPVKGKGLRKTLRDAGYTVLLVDEFRTSCMCYACQCEEGRCEKFLRREHPNVKKAPGRAASEAPPAGLPVPLAVERRERLVHGLLRCKDCNRLWNRDVNSALNMARLTRCALEGVSRPRYLSREEIQVVGKRQKVSGV